MYIYVFPARAKVLLMSDFTYIKSGAKSSVIGNRQSA